LNFRRKRLELAVRSRQQGLDYISKQTS